MGSAAAGEQIAFFALLALGVYLFVVRPQRRRVAHARAVRSALRVGAEVVTAGGLHGRVTAVEAGAAQDGDIVRLEVAAGVEVRLAAGAVVQVLNEPQEPSAPPRG